MLSSSLISFDCLTTSQLSKELIKKTDKYFWPLEIFEASVERFSINGIPFSILLSS